MMNSKNIRMRWIVLIVWMIFIFIMSQQAGDISSEQSKLVVQIISYLGIDLNSTLGNMSTFLIRKCAHFTEYFILYILIYRILIIYYSKKYIWAVGIFAVFLYACTDEFHQSFISGRVAAFSDVCIDTFGGISSATVISSYKKNKR